MKATWTKYVRGPTLLHTLNRGPVTMPDVINETYNKDRPIVYNNYLRILGLESHSVPFNSVTVNKRDGARGIDIGNVVSILFFFVFNFFFSFFFFLFVCLVHITHLDRILKHLFNFILQTFPYLVCFYYFIVISDNAVYPYNTCYPSKQRRNRTKTIHLLFIYVYSCGRLCPF